MAEEQAQTAVDEKAYRDQGKAQDYIDILFDEIVISPEIVAKCLLKGRQDDCR